MVNNLYWKMEAPIQILKKPVPRITGLDKNGQESDLNLEQYIKDALMWSSDDNMPIFCRDNDPEIQLLFKSNDDFFHLLKIKQPSKRFVKRAKHIKQDKYFLKVTHCQEGVTKRKGFSRGMESRGEGRPRRGRGSFS